jgi:hypothetical protein
MIDDIEVLFEQLLQIVDYKTYDVAVSNLRDLVEEKYLGKDDFRLHRSFGIDPCSDPSCFNQFMYRSKELVEKSRSELRRGKYFNSWEYLSLACQVMANIID